MSDVLYAALGGLCTGLALGALAALYWLTQSDRRSRTIPPPASWVASRNTKRI